MPKGIQPFTGKTIRSILFDFGDTLWTRTDPLIWSQQEDAANLRTLALLRTQIEGAVPALDAPHTDLLTGRALRKAIERRIRDYKRLDPEHEPNFAHAACEGLQLFGITHADDTLGAQIFEALRVHVSPARTMFPDALTTLAELQQRGFLLGVVTNRHWGGQPFIEDLHALGLLNYFALDHIAISADLGIRKPNAEIFLYALRAMGIPTDEAVMVGDSLSADIAGANALNIGAIWKPKRSLFAEAKTALATQAANLQVTPTQLRESVYTREAQQLEQTPLESPLDIESTDDDFLINYARQQAGKRKQHASQRAKPDLIIEHLSELLNVFLKAGKQ